MQTQNDVDTDKDGVPDFKDDFPKNAKYSKDADRDGVADPIDDFPRDERYSEDSDGDKVADSEDDFPADPSRSRTTAAMENAVAAAESYLGYTAFSRTSLIEQLEFEGYDTADATFAVDYLKVNWNEQAVKSAKSYLDYTSFFFRASSSSCSSRASPTSRRPTEPTRLTSPTPSEWSEVTC